MGNVWFTSDLHFGHENIYKFRLDISSEEDNRNRIINDWIKLVSKRDNVYVLGDASYTLEGIELFDTLPGIKFLVLGNHDIEETEDYLPYFHKLFGLKKYKEFWLSHAPIHPNELRGKVNLHGHVHYNDIDDPRYFNVCVESLWKRGYPSLISLEQVRKEIEHINTGR